MAEDHLFGAFWQVAIAVALHKYKYNKPFSSPPSFFIGNVQTNPAASRFYTVCTASVP